MGGSSEQMIFHGIIFSPHKWRPIKVLTLWEVQNKDAPSPFIFSFLQKLWEGGGRLSMCPDTPVESRDWRCPQTFLLTHVRFEDYTLIAREANVREEKRLLKIISNFEEALEQEVSKEESEVFFWMLTPSKEKELGISWESKF